MAQRSRFVRPDTRTIPLSDGDTITLRARLTAGERRAMFGRMYRGDTTTVDPIKVQTSTIVAYLLDWNLIGDDGRKVPIAELSPRDVEDVINGLDPESFTELADAVGAHVLRMDAERELEKNGHRGESTSVVTSPFVGSTGGDSPTSEPSTLMNTTS